MKQYFHVYSSFLYISVFIEKTNNFDRKNSNKKSFPFHFPQKYQSWGDMRHTIGNPIILFINLRKGFGISLIDTEQLSFEF